MYMGLATYKDSLAMWDSSMDTGLCLDNPRNRVRLAVRDSMYQYWSHIITMLLV